MRNHFGNDLLSVSDKRVESWVSQGFEYVREQWLADERKDTKSDNGNHHLRDVERSDNAIGDFVVHLFFDGGEVDLLRARQDEINQCLRISANLDDHKAGQLVVVVQKVYVIMSNFNDFVHQRDVLFDGFVDLRKQIVERVLEDVCKELVLVAKIIMQRGAADARLIGDFLHSGFGEPFLKEKSLRRLEDTLL